MAHTERASTAEVLLPASPPLAVSTDPSCPRVSKVPNALAQWLGVESRHFLPLSGRGDGGKCLGREYLEQFPRVACTPTA